MKDWATILLAILAMVSILTLAAKILVGPEARPEERPASALEVQAKRLKPVCFGALIEVAELDGGSSVCCLRCRDDGLLSCLDSR